MLIRLFPNAIKRRPIFGMDLEVALRNLRLRLVPIRRSRYARLKTNVASWSFNYFGKKPDKHGLIHDGSVAIVEAGRVKSGAS